MLKTHIDINDYSEYRPFADEMVYYVSKIAQT